VLQGGCFSKSHFHNAIRAGVSASRRKSFTKKKGRSWDKQKLLLEGITKALRPSESRRRVLYEKGKGGGDAGEEGH